MVTYFTLFYITSGHSTILVENVFQVTVSGASREPPYKQLLRHLLLQRTELVDPLQQFPSLLGFFRSPLGHVPVTTTRLNRKQF